MKRQNRPHKLLQNSNAAVDAPIMLRNVFSYTAKARVINLEKARKIRIAIEDKKQKNRAQILRSTAGKLKGKLPENPVAWQRKIRAEWDHRLPS